jgi:tetratricopeptide (TPR) repeat protein
MLPSYDSESSEGAPPVPVRVGLRHEPFFEALATLGGHEGQREWRALIAGLVTLRLADRCFAGEEGRSPWRSKAVRKGHPPADTSPEVIEAARVAVSDVDEREAVASPLRSLFQSASGITPGDIPLQLLSYGNALFADSRWVLAADVYRTILQLAVAPRGADIYNIWRFVSHVYDRLGRSLRMMGDIDAARTAYEAGRAAAHDAGDDVTERLIRISEANVAMHLGNLPAAASTLDAIIAEATAAEASVTSGSPEGEPHPAGSITSGPDHQNVIALAYHDRAVVASRQRDFSLAVECYFAAWRVYREPLYRERVWVDLALTFSEMGHRDVAREAFLALCATARSREVRLIATTNLLELAVLDGREDLFEGYRSVLRAAEDGGTLPAETMARFALYEGRGELRFGRPSGAMAAFERALDLAARHRVHEVTIRADEAIVALRAGRIDARPSGSEVPPSMTPAVERITRVVRRVRRRAGSPHLQ